ncbi:MAG: hypothetical protein O3A00_05920 [Planctomycetota bacterium]|nr:hypothetical protein [Planctomycetota bacterium]
MGDLSALIRISPEQPAAKDGDYWQQITDLTGIAYPPATKLDWLRLLTLAGFAQREADSVFRELGYDGYDRADEFPSNYVSTAGQSPDGRTVEPLDEPLMLTARILAGLEPLRRRMEAPVDPEWSPWIRKAAWCTAMDISESTVTRRVKKYGETNTSNQRLARFPIQWLKDAGHSIPSTGG